MLEVIARERETELSRIAKDKEVEGEKREIADVIRERIAVEKTVAEQEESIKSSASSRRPSGRARPSSSQAEAEAQERLVKDIKAAEAAEEAAKFTGPRGTAARRGPAADRRARRPRQDPAGRGHPGRAAASGLADVQVRERGRRGDREGRPREAAVGRRRAVAAEAVPSRAGRGRRRATGIREKLKAEAEGLTDKAAGMAAMDDATRGHEEYRLRLEAEKEIRLAGLDVQRRGRRGAGDRAGDRPGEGRHRHRRRGHHVLRPGWSARSASARAWTGSSSTPTSPGSSASRG